METRLRVRYAETDQMGVVYHANYLVWMEIGRVEFCRARGLSYRELESRDGIFLVVVEAHCRYHAAARYDEEVIVDTRIVAAGARMVEFGYEMKALEGGRTLATAETRHVFCNRQMRPCRLPEKHRQLFAVQEG